VSGIEFYGSTAKRANPFPSSWGRPPADEEQRGLWIFEHAMREHPKTQRRAVAREHTRMLARLAETRPSP
jgi:hypothetical protein